MDLSNKPRHTYRELGRLRVDARGDGGIRDFYGQKVLQDVLMAKVRVRHEPLARLADELAKQAISQPKKAVDNDLIFGTSLQLVLSFKKLLETAFSSARPSSAVEPLSNGHCVEHFDNGSEILKDALGSVQEVTSPWGERLCFSYDSSGNLDSFVRVDSQGSLKMRGRRDKHGVVVGNCQGRICAVGVSMAVDPWGRLTVHNTGGQFLALDLVQELHIERRILDALDKSCKAVTGVFAYDGFRMATVFQGFDKDCSVDMSGQDRTCRLRFYGRDGSAIEFGGEEELKRVCPTRVWPPGSFFLQPFRRGRHQAITAWESMKTYLSIIS